MRIKLMPGERVILRTRPNALPLVGPVISGFLILAVGGFSLGYLSRGTLPEWLEQWQGLLLPVAFVLFLLLPLRAVVWPLLRWSGNRYVLTTTRLIHRYGVLRRTEKQISLSAISQLQTEQSLLQRMVGSGSLTADLGFDRAHAYRHLPQVTAFKEHVIRAISELPLTRMFDGVDMDIDAQYARGGTPRSQQEGRGEQS